MTKQKEDTCGATTQHVDVGVVKVYVLPTKHNQSLFKSFCQPIQESLSHYKGQFTSDNIAVTVASCFG